MEKNGSVSGVVNPPFMGPIIYDREGGGSESNDFLWKIFSRPTRRLKKKYFRRPPKAINNDRSLTYWYFTEHKISALRLCDSSIGMFVDVSVSLWLRPPQGVCEPHLHQE